jgi:PPM family protein phosphatase
MEDQEERCRPLVSLVFLSSQSVFGGIFMLLDTAWRSDRGNKKSDNQDVIRVYEEQGLFMLADGMGGMDGGGFASIMAVEQLSPLVLQDIEADAPDPSAQLRDRISQVSRKMWELSVGSRALFGMGSTLVLLLIRNGCATIAHAGDSRAYLFREGALECLTCDHSVAYDMVRRGEISAEQGDKFPFRNPLSRHMGLKELDAEIQTRTVRNEALFILCSDGLHKELSDADIAEIAASTDSALELCDRLVEQAMERGGRDNISVVVVRIVD